MDLPTSPTRQFSLAIVVPVRRERLEVLRSVLEKIRQETISLMGGEKPPLDPNYDPAEPDEATPAMPFDKIKTIHYARWVLIYQKRDFISGPQLAFATNYDGPVGKSDCSEEEAREAHIRELIEHGRDTLHEIYRCCVGYGCPGADASDEESEKALTDYLSDPEHQYPSATFYVGTSGRSRDQVLGEAALRRRVDDLIDQKQMAGGWPEKTSDIRRDLRADLRKDDEVGEIPPFPPQPDVVKTWKKYVLIALFLLGGLAVAEAWSAWDWWYGWLTIAAVTAIMYAAVRLLQLELFWEAIGYALLTLLIIPGIMGKLLSLWDWLLSLSSTWQIVIIAGMSATCIALMAVVAAVLASTGEKPDVEVPGTTVSASAIMNAAGLVIGLLLYLSIMTSIMVSPDWVPRAPYSWDVWLDGFTVMVLAVFLPLAAVTFVAVLVAKRLEYLEATDPQFQPEFCREELDHICWSSRDENIFFQNQLSNIAVLKPGGFRTFLLRGVFYALQILAITVYNKGKLGDIPTIHFARWIFIDGGRRLLFFSNFDSSWQSYLGDFIDQASDGLTAVWSNTVGYPRTRNLVQAGSRSADRFKAWARHQQIPTQVWYSAYPGLSVRNVNDNTVIRRGLAAQSSDVSDEEWLDALHGRIQ